MEFTAGRLKIKADFSFFAVIALLLMLNSEINIISAFSVCFIHETGHLIPMIITGEKIRLIRFYGAGIRIVNEKNPFRAFYKDMIILWGGSITNFAAAAVSAVLCGGMNIFSVMNIVTGIFNLLPYRNFDGGEILMMLIEYYGSENMKYHIHIIMRITGGMVSLLIVLFFYFSGMSNITLIITVLYLAVISS